MSRVSFQPTHFLTSITRRFAPEQQGFTWLQANKTQPYHPLFVKYKAEIFPFFSVHFLG